MKLTVANILAGVELLNYELSTEGRLVRVGLKDEQQTAAILQKFDWLCGREPLEFIRDERDGAADADTREWRDRLYYALVELYLYRQVAPLSDHLQTALAKKEVAGIPYYNLAPRLQNEPDFDRREQLGEMIDAVHVEFNPQKLELLRREIDILKVDLGQPSYRDYCRQKKQFKYPALEAGLRESLARTEPVYRRHIARWTDRKVGRPFGALNRYHASYLLRLNDFDAHFPKDALVERLTAALRHLGIDLAQAPNIHLDLENRPKKTPRAFCSAPKIPAEVWLVIKPAGGLNDYETFLHEAGHALHFGCSRADLPYEYRHLARSYALSEIYSFLLQNLVQDVGWLRAVARVDEAAARQIRYEKILSDLFMYRRYVAKFLAEWEFFQQPDLGNGEIYARTLTAATGFVYRPTNYLFDMDSEFYSADYLRAWLGEAQLREYLQQQYGPTWWSNAAAGKFLVGLWHQAGQPDAETVIAQLGVQPLDPAALERRVAELEALN